MNTYNTNMFFSKFTLQLIIQNKLEKIFKNFNIVGSINDYEQIILTSLYTARNWALHVPHLIPTPANTDLETIIIITIFNILKKNKSNYIMYNNDANSNIKEIFEGATNYIIEII